MKTRRLFEFVSSLLLAGGAWGCTFSASTSANADLKNGADAEAKLDAQQLPSEAGDKGPQITYREGQLDYQGTINFEYDKAALKNDAQTQLTLKDFAEFLSKHLDVTIQIEGHTDSRGSDDYNRELSDRRAASVRQWLIDNGVDASRLTAVGKGEDAPQAPEPEGCDDQRPLDNAPCEAAWATNRRVVFQVTGGAKKLEQLQLEPVPEKQVAKDAPPAVIEDCPWLVGAHLNLIGPNSWIGGAIAVQPGICWLEPSLGVGFGFGDLEADRPSPGTSGEGSYSSLSIPLRARIWFMQRHSPIADVGLGYTSYSIEGDLSDAAGLSASYQRDSGVMFANAGLGYGFRANGFLAGPRLGIVIGAVVPFGDLEASEVSPAAGFNPVQGAALQSRLDSDSNPLSRTKPYGEISLGWLF